MAISTKLLVNKFIRLDQKIKAKDEDVKKLKEEREAIGAILKNRFEEAGIQSMKSKAGVTVYIRRELWANFAEGCEAALQAGLKALGMGDMVKEKVNTQTLSAYVREVESQHFNGEKVEPAQIIEQLPESIRNLVKVSEKFETRARNS